MLARAARVNPKLLPVYTEGASLLSMMLYACAQAAVTPNQQLPPKRVRAMFSLYQGYPGILLPTLPQGKFPPPAKNSPKNYYSESFLGASATPVLSSLHHLPMDL